MNNPGLWRHACLLLTMLVLLPGCFSSCDPAVVPMPEGYDDITFNIDTGHLVARGATDYGSKIPVWRDGTPIELSHRDKKRLRAFYQKCDDTDLCDEVSYNFERSDDGDLHLTLVRFGPALLSAWKNNRMYVAETEERCDTYKALGRDLWDEPSDTELDGTLEIFEINDRYWGAVLCTDFSGAHLFVGRKMRIEEMYGG